MAAAASAVLNGSVTTATLAPGMPIRGMSENDVHAAVAGVTQTAPHQPLLKFLWSGCQVSVPRDRLRLSHKVACSDANGRALSGAARFELGNGPVTKGSEPRCTGVLRTGNKIKTGFDLRI